ncbi:transglycosylase family protein [Paeniglutamicibacter sulfureus]|uniref:LysM peptidoglycan-binding domain-containing protein n=1 Tax=Paeniglutamicibacter sulfureus TaxID=43666 RepID=UPI002665EF36|nr:transglycosylase family protein [Paeniglutamicibacter sulfureus]MDO2934063.1 transglycosylase family protein [Paeniglutamicibacter sulfureus]
MIQQNSKSKNIRRGAASVAALALAGGAMAMSVAPASAASTSTWDALAQCESGGDWSINTGNGYKGGLQFSSSTWSAFGGSGSANNASKSEQIRVAERVKASQGWGAWPACSAKLGLSGGKGSVAKTYESAPKKETVKKSSESSYKTSSTKSYKTKSVPAKSYASSGKRAAAPVAKAPAISVNVKDSGENYTVKAGDTMFKIAQSQGLSSWQDLHALNQDVVPSADLIFVGQSLDLPTK